MKRLGHRQTPDMCMDREELNGRQKEMVARNKQREGETHKQAKPLAPGSWTSVVSRTLTKYISVVFPAQSVALCYGNPNKRIYYAFPPDVSSE